MTAREAAELLGVKLATLYAYTSRGLIRSVSSHHGRARRYRKADLDRLRARRDARAGHGPVAAGALRFGEPVLDTSLTQIDRVRGPIYRGLLAADLAERGVSFEVVSELLWTGSLPAQPSGWIAHDLPISLSSLRRLLPADVPPLSLLAFLVPLLASRDPGRFSDRNEAVLPRARTLIRRMAGAIAPGLDAQRVEAAFRCQRVAEAIATALGADAGVGGGADGLRALDRALVLCADHELNASAFAARVAASTGADLYACVAAALATLSGPRHGGAAARVEALIAEIGDPDQAERVVHERARRGDIVEGFGHPLYPNGDPRGFSMLAEARQIAPDHASVRCCDALVEAMAGSGGGPTVELGLVSLSAALALAPGSATAIFAIARCSGWVAHVLEQYEAGYLVRPRARYLERD